MMPQKFGVYEECEDSSNSSYPCEVFKKFSISIFSDVIWPRSKCNEPT